jgi:hypothetical protein
MFLLPEKPYKVYSSDKNPVGNRSLNSGQNYKESTRNVRKLLIKLRQFLILLPKGNIYVEWQTPDNRIVVWLKE